MSTLEQFGAKTWPTLRGIEKDDLGDVICPASGAYADHTRGEIEIPVTRLADEDLRTALEAEGIETLRGRGYESPEAEVLMPETTSGPEAHGYSNRFVGVPAVVDGERAWVPVRQEDLLEADLEGLRRAKQDAAESQETTDGHEDDESAAEDEPGPTRVGHCEHDDCDVYVGRGGPDGEIDLLSAEYVGQRGYLGNPYPAEQFGREQAVAMFCRAFMLELEHRPELRRAVYQLRGQVIGCWCQRLEDDGPLCHAEVIAQAADRAVHAGTERNGGDPA